MKSAGVRVHTLAAVLAFAFGASSLAGSRAQVSGQQPAPSNASTPDPYEAIVDAYRTGDDRDAIHQRTAYAPGRAAVIAWSRRAWQAIFESENAGSEPANLRSFVESGKAHHERDEQVSRLLAAAALELETGRRRIDEIGNCRPGCAAIPGTRTWR
jgi:hypothetical protein